MLLKKPGFPEEGEFVLCTVTNVQPHSVFVVLDEYGKQGMIHISEVSPGRIRNIRDFVKESKKIICLVLNINKEKDHIDLSLRRVNENQKRAKINDIKQQQLAEKIIEYVAKKTNFDINALFEKILEKALKKYPNIYSYFESVTSGDSDLNEIGLSSEIKTVLLETLNQRIRPAEVEIKGELRLASYAPDGVEIIKSALIKGIESGKGNTSISYEGGGKYKIMVKSKTYKNAEKILDNNINSITKFMEKTNSEIDFIREGR